MLVSENGVQHFMARHVLLLIMSVLFYSRENSDNAGKDGMGPISDIVYQLPREHIW